MRWPKSDRGMLAAAAVGAAGALAYVGYAAAQGFAGFPLDDGWIHQTYARNLVETGVWAYVPGEVSAGSTSPLWTLILALGYTLGVPFRAWTAAAGALSLAAVAVVAGRVARRLTPCPPLAGWAAALACALEWHLLWAGASGMETALFAALALAVLGGALGLAREERLWAWLGWGLLGGAAFLTRPEGLLPLGLAGACLVVARRADWTRDRRRAALARYGLAAAGFLALAIPYLVFNWKASGTILPNTFYAKQAEYREVAEALPWLVRAARVAGVQFVGGMALLVPGMVAAWRDIVRRRDWMGFLPLAWWAATVALYATRLPVTYQHGRYVMPVIPVLLVYGAPGTALLVNAAHGRVGRILSRAVALAACAVFAAFVVVGARAYLADVRIIDSEMVDVARWLDASTPPDAVIAVHDIGAVGYFTRRPLVDLAGLVSPEVVPFIRDESRLYDYIRARGASYLVTFPSWYPQMTARPDVVMVYQTRSPWTIQAGGDNMAVYRLR
ncbi:MAG: hypothetical protein Kow00123_19640 [Anaerolineales bacterium]